MLSGHLLALEVLRDELLGNVNSKLGPLELLVGLQATGGLPCFHHVRGSPNTTAVFRYRLTVPVERSAWIRSRRLPLI